MLHSKIPYNSDPRLEDWVKAFMSRKVANTGDIMWLILKAYEDGKKAGYEEGLNAMDERMFS
jgi:hypothetical protein